jgi:hypothetical protein
VAAAWQATGTLLGSTGADITPVIPSHLADDILILQAWSRGNAGTLATPSGWNFIAGINSVDIVCRWYWKRATSAAEANPLCDWSSVTGDKYAVVHCIRGCVKFWQPFQIFPASIIPEAGVTDPHVMAAITRTHTDSLLIVTAAVLDNLATGMTVTTGGAPAALTQRSFTTVATGSDAGQGIATAANAATGAIAITCDFTGGVPGQHAIVALEFISDTGGALVGPARWQDTGTLAASTGADITPVIPAHAANDLLFMQAFARTSGITCETPAGWTRIGSQNPGSQQMWWFYRIAISAAETDPLCDFSSVTGDKYAVVWVIRGVKSFEFTGSVPTFITAALGAVPGNSNITTQNANSLVFHGGIASDDSASDIAVTTNSTPSALVTRSFETTAIGSDAASWAASEIMSAAATIQLSHAFTGSAPAIYSFCYAAFTSLPSAAATAPPLPASRAQHVARLSSF